MFIIIISCPHVSVILLILKLTILHYTAWPYEQHCHLCMLLKVENCLNGKQCAVFVSLLNFSLNRHGQSNAVVLMTKYIRTQQIRV